MKAKRPLTMRISLNALEHLGMNLYLEVHIKIDKLWSVFQAIDDFAPQTD